MFKGLLNRLFAKPDITVHFNDGPFVEITNKAAAHTVLMKAGDRILHSAALSGEQWTRAHRRYLTGWTIQVLNDRNKTIFEHRFDLSKKNVRVNIDSKSLGDTLAWVPQVQAFARQYPGSTVFLSQFYTDLFDQDAYPQLHFISPESVVQNCYATFNIGYYFKNTDWYHPTDPRTEPLAKVSADILGIDYVEARPALQAAQPLATSPRRYVCIATASTAACKHWLRQCGWQSVVDYLRGKGLDVMVIQKENTALTNVIDQTGDQPLTSRIAQIKGAQLFIGLGSGLSWLAWALEKPVVLISGFSEPYTEFQSNCERVLNPDFCHGCWNDTRYEFDRDDWNWCPRHKDTARQFECSHSISAEMVLDAIDRSLQKI